MNVVLAHNHLFSIFVRHTSFRLSFFISISESAKLAQVSSDSPPPTASCAYELHQLVIFDTVLRVDVMVQTRYQTYLSDSKAFQMKNIKYHIDAFQPVSIF